jgi:hypothetical protein
MSQVVAAALTRTPPPITPLPACPQSSVPDPHAGSNPARAPLTSSPDRICRAAPQTAFNQGLMLLPLLPLGGAVAIDAGGAEAAGILDSAASYGSKYVSGVGAATREAGSRILDTVRDPEQAAQATVAGAAEGVKNLIWAGVGGALAIATHTGEKGSEPSRATSPSSANTPKPWPSR